MHEPNHEGSFTETVACAMSLMPFQLRSGARTTRSFLK